MNAAADNDGQFSSGVEFLSKSLKTVFVILGVVIIGAIVWFLTCGGSFIVDSASQSVIVLKFGKFQGQYDRGWHWFLPYPVNKTLRISTARQTLTTRAFMPADSAKLYDASAKGVSYDESLIPGRDGYAILGDTTMLHSEWVMTYSVSDPTKYFLNCMSRETAVASTNTGVKSSEEVGLEAAAAILRNQLDDAVITTSASLSIANSYYDKSNYEQAVRQILIDRIAALDIGVTLESLSLKIVRPPVSTLSAFEQLLLAEQVAERDKEEARTQAVQERSAARSEAQRITAEAEAYKQQVASEIKADVEMFKQILSKYRENEKATIVALYTAAVAEAVAKVRDKYAINVDGNTESQIRVKLAPRPVKRKTNEAHNESGGAK